MKYSVLLVDDEPKANEMLKSILEEYHPNYYIKAICTSSREAKKLLLMNHFDLVFLDINMPDNDGFKLVKDINSKHKMPAFIFVSAHSKYMPEAFKVQPFDFLTKPVMLEELKSSLDRFKEQREEEKQIDKNREGNIIINTQNGLERIEYNDILYFETNNRKLNLYLNDYSSLVINMTLDKLNSLLSSCFVKVNRQIVVNMNHVKILKIDQSLTLINNKEIKLGKRFKQDVVKAFYSKK